MFSGRLRRIFSGRRREGHPAAMLFPAALGSAFQPQQAERLESSKHPQHVALMHPQLFAEGVAADVCHAAIRLGEISTERASEALSVRMQSMGSYVLLNQRDPSKFG